MTEITSDRAHLLRAEEWMRKANLRPTKLRLKTAELLLQATSPVGAESLFHQLISLGETISVGTVSRILSELEQHGFIKRDWLDIKTSSKVAFVVIGDSRRSSECCLLCPCCLRRQIVANRTLANQLSRIASGHGYAAPPQVVIPLPCSKCAAKLRARVD